ncbi:MAG: aldose epimerase family protein [Phycisphaerae bacterium]|jgi:aldose 1-epimerase
MTITKTAFGQTPDGQTADLYTLTNGNGMKVQITNYGGIITSIVVPDKNGKFEDVALGYDNLADYIKNSPYFGALIGRYGNRIAGGKFTLDGKEYKLFINNDPNSLHGGKKGFDKVLWKAEPVEGADVVGLKLTYLSKDMEEGYPGNLNATVWYFLTRDNELQIKYEATTDKPTVVNLTNHSYFNLAGAGNGDVLDHVMMLNADRFLPVDKTLIPTGELRPVKGTPFDFTTPTPIGKNIKADDEQVKFGNGWDHAWVLNKPKAGELTLAARVVEPTSGRMLEMYTTEPAVQFYSGNFLDGTTVGKGGKPYKFRYAFCLEAEHYPDSPNQPKFPSTVLRPGETYRQTTVYKFSTK